MPDIFWVECPDCLGECIVEYEVPSPNFRYGGELIGEFRHCETCEGHGEVKHEEE